MQRDRILSLGVLLVVLILYIESFNITNTGFQAFDSAIFPRILLGAIGVTALIIFIKTFFVKKENEEKDPTVKRSLKIFWRDYYKVIILFVLFGMYVYFLPFIGFIISTLVFLFISQSLLYGFKEFKKLILNLIVSVVTTTIVFLIFNEGLNILLP